MWVQSLGQEDPLKEEMATHSTLLAWRVPWTEEPGGLHSLWGRKESDRTKRACISTHTSWLIGAKQQQTPLSCLPCRKVFAHIFPV